MNGIRYLLITVLLQCLCAEGAPREKLHLVYVTNRDRAPLSGYEGRLHRIMVDVQDFFRTEMERNGLGPKSYALDIGKEGQAIVHLVTLDWDFDPARKFTPNDLRPVIAENLLKKGIDIEQEYIVVFENVYWQDQETWKYDLIYTGSGDSVKGATWVADHEWLDPQNIDPKRKERLNDRGQKLSIGQFNVKMIGGVAHEFGHGLGLPHNRETDDEFKQHGKALMGAGNYTYRQERLGRRHGSFLTPAHAFILSLHPLFSGQVDADFSIPDAFPEDLTFDSTNGQLIVSGRIIPSDEIAGIVFYHDPLPTGINKDYDAFSYLAAMEPDGTFSASMPLIDDKDCALHLEVYSKSGMHRKFTFNQTADQGLKTLRADYVRAEAKHAFLKKDAVRLKTLLAKLEKIDASVAKDARLFLRIAEQWLSFSIPSEIAKTEKKVSLSSTRWDDATVGWYVPSFNGVLEPDGKWFRPLETTEGRCSECLFAHAPSSYVYSLGGKWKKLQARCGIMKHMREGSVVFVVKGDGKELYRSSLIRVADGEVPFDVDISGVQTLELLTEPGADSNAGDWGIWVEPTLMR